MVLTISTTHRPATDLGYLLHKNPTRTHTLDLTFGNAHVLYPEASEERCTAALVIDVDSVGLVRGKRGANEGGLLEQYVNDRPYAACSLMSTAIVEAFKTAINGRCKERPELAETAIPLEARIPALPAKGGVSFVSGLFEPLGYEVDAKPIPLSDEFPEWGASRYVDLTLKATILLSDLLIHLYVLIPVLDNSKHYWVDEQEVEKLLKRGEGWLAGHPLKEEITRRYLRNQWVLTRMALARLAEQDDDPDPDEQSEENAAAEEVVERKISLHGLRLEAVMKALKASGARRVLDLGCGEGRLLELLLKDRQFEEIVGMDVAFGQLERAKKSLRLDRLPPMVANRLQLIHGSLTYRDPRLAGFDAAAVVEVIEHLDPPRLKSFERIVFEFARPQTVVITTPNREYNVLFESMPLDRLRHRDHRFEWTREEFELWAASICDRFGYSVTFEPIGPVDPTYGAPSQMAVFGPMTG